MKLSITIFITLAMTLTAANNFAQSAKKKEVVNLKGATIYYEVYGSGKPLFLLHGFTQSSVSWLSFVAEYADEYEVYLVDLQGHGKSGQFKGKISIKSVASELDDLIRYLKLDSIDAIGYSYGGEVLFQLALLHPGLIKSMIVIGSCGSWNAKDYPRWLEFLSYKNIDNLPWMREQQTSEEQIRAILDQMANYDIYVSEAELKSIRARTLFVIGDKDDGVTLECLSLARKNLPESYLWIVPNAGHGAHKDNHKTDFINTSKEFFKGSWVR